MGPVALVIREQPTVREVIRSLAHHQPLHSEVTILRLEEQADIAIIRVDVAVPGPHRQSTELILGQLLRVLRAPLGPDWRPLSVSLIHAPPRSMATHQRVFRCEVLFNQDFDGVVFDRADLDRANPFADPELARQVERYVGGLVAASASPAERVRLLVSDRLATGKCTLDLVARQLGLEPRTLQRQLAAAGTSFGQIVQDVRMGLARRYLEESDRPLTEVAELLGFSALSAFSRWRRAHDGRPPSEGRGGPST